MKRTVTLLGALSLFVLVSGCDTTNQQSNASSNTVISSSAQPDLTWSQYASDTTNWIHQYTNMLSEYHQFIKDSNAGKYDSLQTISTIGTMQTQMVSLKMDVDTYIAADPVYDEHQLFIKAVDDLNNAMQGIIDAQTDETINTEQAQKDVANANSFSSQAAIEMQKYLSTLSQHLKGK